MGLRMCFSPYVLIIDVLQYHCTKVKNLEMVELVEK